MQRATSRATAGAGSSGCSNMQGGRAVRGLHSPGDSSPPGIQFTRGSFSEHLLSLDPPAPVSSRQTQAASATATRSLLRSPTRKRPPPAPSSAPKPPSGIRSRATAAASSILMPSPPSSASKASRQPPASPLSRSIKEPAPPPPTPDSNDTLELSVNPVDALAKKLRQQAAELTQVYEQMEKKDQDLDQLRGQVKQLSIQADVQRTKQRVAMSSRSALVSSTTRSVVSTVKRSMGTPARRISGVGGSPPRGETSGSRAPTSAHHQERVEETREAICRIEEALLELREHHRELFAQRETVETSDLQHEQQLYIRVLEEAVHLKASELCITGHEELLVVLAELRHTIYQQENEIGELQKSLSSTRSEQLECKTLQLEADDKLQRETSRWEQETAAQRLRETSLQRKLEEVQRLAHAEHMRFRQERALHEEQAMRITVLEKELQMKAQEVHKAEATRESKTKKEASMKKQIDELQQTVDQERTQAARVNEDLTKSRSQVDELKALQEGLLQSIDQFVTKEDAFERRIKALKEEAACTHQLRTENEVFKSTSERLRQQITVLEEQSTKASCLAEKWVAIETSNAKMEQLSKEWASTSEEVTASGLEVVLRWLDVLKQSDTESLTWLRPFVEQAAASVNATRVYINHLEVECTTLRESKQVFEESHASTGDEVRRLQETLGESQIKLVQAKNEIEEQALQLAAMEEEIQDARAQEHLRDALAEQIFEQENLLSTQQQRLQSVLLQNAELMALETQFATQLEQKDQELVDLQRRLRRYLEQETVLHELERELEAAASLTEQQNSWNQQLTETLDRVEWEKAEQVQLLEAVEAREQVVVARLTTIFSQYVQFVSANKQRLAHEFSVGRDALANQATPKTIYDEARESGDVIQMLRVFPTLVEEYLASAVLGATSHPGSAKKRWSKANQNESMGLVTISGSRRPPNAKSAPQTHPIVDADTTDPLAAQLREIANAFNKFKSV